LTVCSITQVHIIKYALASCTTTSLFYVSLFKELFLCANGIFAESGCKGTNFFRTGKLFTENFSRKSKKNLAVDLCQPPETITPYYIII
jgi:hypothetical protein